MRFALTRRGTLAAIAGLATASYSHFSKAGPSATKITVTKDPNCGCCSGWVDHLRQAEFSVDVVENSELDQVKTRLGVPQALAACHTAEVDGYVIEGHVPAVCIRRLLAEQPKAKGVAVPGMPVGSPGMEVHGARPDTYTVFLFGPFGRRPYARFEGTQELPI
jgi:hypothetical protein